MDEVLDINGWDIRKALGLLYKSNPTLFEWSNSPIVYKRTKEWGEVKRRINEFFISKAGLYHYLSTAKSNYREYLKGENVRIKKYFYVLRPILACKWILNNQSPPPMLFEELMKEYLDEEIKPFVFDLLDKKRNSLEMGEDKRIDEINEYIDKSFIAIQHEIDALKDKEKNNWNELNKIFLNIIK